MVMMKRVIIIMTALMSMEIKSRCHNSVVAVLMANISRAIEC